MLDTFAECSMYVTHPAFSAAEKAFAAAEKTFSAAEKAFSAAGFA